MGDRCKLCNRELDPMPDFHYLSRHLRLKHNIDTSEENVADYFEADKDKNSVTNE